MGQHLAVDEDDKDGERECSLQGCIPQEFNALKPQGFEHGEGLGAGEGQQTSKSEKIMSRSLCLRAASTPSPAAPADTLTFFCLTTPSSIAEAERGADTPGSAARLKDPHTDRRLSNAR